MRKITSFKSTLLTLFIFFGTLATFAQTIDVVDNNTNSNVITSLHGYCNGVTFTYKVYWESTTVTDVELVNSSDTVIASGSTSPLMVTTSSSTTTPITLRLRDANNITTESSPFAVNRLDCSVFTSVINRSSGSYTVPVGVTSVQITAVGGGGGGGGKSTSSTQNKAGGGGGGSARSTITVANPEVLAYTVGGGGMRGTSSSQNGQNGGTTTMTRSGVTLVRATL